MRAGYVAVMLFAFLTPKSVCASAFEAISSPKAFHFDVADGYYQDWSGKVLCPINAIRAVVHFARYGRPTTRWRPGIVVFVRRREGKTERLARLGIRAKYYKPPFYTQLGAAVVGSKDLGHHDFRTTTGEKGVFTFLMWWNGRGEVAASIGNETQVVWMGARPDTININGSTGAGSVTFELGHVSEGKRDTCKAIA